MNTTLPDTWYEANQRYLSAALAIIRATLERHAAHVRNAPEPDGIRTTQRRRCERRPTP